MRRTVRTLVLKWTAFRRTQLEVDQKYDLEISIPTIEGDEAVNSKQWLLDWISAKKALAAS